MIQKILYSEMVEVENKAPINAMAEEAVVKTLAYFDIFNYPLTLPEIKTFLGVPVPPETLDAILNVLTERKIIFLLDGFYAVQNNPLLVCRRKLGNDRATVLLRKANRIGRFLYQFPFVKAVGVSGSLSKNFAPDKADIDFFIITSTGRLWIARTLMHIYKKFTFLTGRQHYHCMNYYMDEEAYLLREQNIFTAIELKTLLPVCGGAEFNALWAANEWANDWLPHCTYRHPAQPDPRRSRLKKWGEWILNKKIFNRLDDYLLHITTRRWKRKQQQGATNEKGMVMGLITDKHFAKSNAGDFQGKVLMLYKNKVTALLQKL
jgi:hypothetical protein